MKVMFNIFEWIVQLGIFGWLLEICLKERHWVWIALNLNLTEQFMRVHKKKLCWYIVSTYQELSEDFMEEFVDFVYWHEISVSQELREEFMRKHKDILNWYCLSRNQILSEEFINEYADIVSWNQICTYQTLSKDFMEKHADRIVWNVVSATQQLSEGFIRKHAAQLNWYSICMYQRLNEVFIVELTDLVVWDYVQVYQNLTEDFIKQHKLQVLKSNWNYMDDWKKAREIDKTNSYNIKEGYVYGYKVVDDHYRSIYDRRVQYKIGEIFEDWHYDANCNHCNSFGLSMWTKREALQYAPGRLLKVRAKLCDIKALVLYEKSSKWWHHDTNKIRCSKLEILEEV